MAKGHSTPNQESAGKEHGDTGIADLLIEIGCEELPPKALDELREALFAGVRDGLERENLAFDAASSRSFSTPRRLALLFSAVPAAQADQNQTRRGPAVAAAFTAEGKPTGAALGFAKSVGLSVEQLERLETDAGSWLVAQIHVPGKSLAQLVFSILEQAVRQLPVPRPMRWASHDFSFVRPVHWLVVMHGSHILPGTLLGQLAGNTTRGHRIHAPGPHQLMQASDYLPVLEKARVLADQNRRKEVIRLALLAANPATRIAPSLLDEVNNLVEWPVAIACRFDAEFLSVPHEALVASMQDHQKFFPVEAEGNTHAVDNQFIAVSNLESKDVAQVRKGFERVIRARLADARFFLEQDQKQPLERNLVLLDQVIFQQKIGSIGDKSRRIAAISQKIAEILHLDRATCHRAALLAKCDLLTQMVGEFPELQGTMGRYYALHGGEPVEVADAIEQHYLPRFAGDALPAAGAGQVLGLADRADTLVAIFAAGLKPTGNKDPFALRRSALGLVRILLEGRLELSLDRLLAITANELSAQGVRVEPALLAELRDFIAERTRNYFREDGHGAEVINATMASGWTTLPDLQARLEALSMFLGQETGVSLAAANKRIGNILRKAEQGFGTTINQDLLNLAEEQDLFMQIEKTGKELQPLLHQGDYAAGLKLLSRLRPSVDRFFDAVMVMDEDAGLRNNRLALLGRLKSQFDQIADLSVLA